MGMTIEEIIKTFNYIKQVGNGESEYRHCRQEIALDEAVTILQKYQKIVDIVSLNGEEFKQCGLKELKEILEVIADGNDD